MSRLVVACYTRCLADGSDQRLALVAHVEQDSGESCTSELALVWHDATLADFARLEFDAEELVGAVECIEERFWSLEREACRVANVRQRMGAGAAA